MKLSVALITYNHEKYIEQALSSVLMQETDFDFEIVVGEDCSTDRTAELIRQLQIQYPERIRVLPADQNLGMMRNFIRTIQACGGQYIALLEGDDYWTSPHKLQKQVDFLERYPEYAGAFHETQTLYENGTAGQVYGRSAHRTAYAADTVTGYAPFHTSSFLFRKDAAFFPDWFYRVISADMALFSIVAARGPLKKISEVMSIYRIHSGGITRTREVMENFYEQRIELIHHLNQFHDYRFNAKAQQVIAGLRLKQSGRQRLPGPRIFLERLRTRLQLQTQIRRLFHVG